MLWNRSKIFSIIIPVYNGEKTIERTFASLISNLKYIKEVIVIDDASTDKTKSIIDKYSKNGFLPIIYIKNKKNVGAGRSRKIGIEAAKSEWITFVDADDCLTPNSLKYVHDLITDNPNLKILHCQTIYYESGTFNADSINYSDTSCGGNFYNLQYLKDNDLYPHDTLPLAEDQYFNEKIMYYIDYFDTDNKSEKVGHYDYPVYEVHHDIDDVKSFAIRNWADYCCKYRLLYKQYLIEDILKICDNYEVDEYGYVDYDRDELWGALFFDYATNLIFAYYLSCQLEYDDDIDFKIDDNLKYFIDAYNFGKEVFEHDYNYYQMLFDETPEIFDEIEDSSCETTGIYDEINYDFIGFIKKIKEMSEN